MTNLSIFDVILNRVSRHEYEQLITINKRHLKRIVIDQHYRLKHGNLTDKKILDLVKTLDLGNFTIEKKEGDFEYFAVEPVLHEGRAYRLVLLLCTVEDYLGVVNAFRVKEKDAKKNKNF